MSPGSQLLHTRKVLSAPWGAYTGTSQAGILLKAQPHSLSTNWCFPIKNVSGNGSSLTAMGANTVGRVDNSREAA